MYYGVFKEAFNGYYYRNFRRVILTIFKILKKYLN